MDQVIQLQTRTRATGVWWRRRERRAQQEHWVQPVHQERQDLKVRPELQGHPAQWEFKGRRAPLVRRELQEQREQMGVVLIFATHSMPAQVTRSMMWSPNAVSPS